MMPLPSARRAEDFAAALEGRAPERGLDGHTERLVSLAHAVRSVERVELRPALSADLRARLVAEADLLGSQAPTGHRAVAVRPRDVRRRRLTSLAAAACVTIGAGAGVAAASQSALPGETLYPVKRGIEQVELTLAGGGEGRGQELLEHAGTRLVEAQDLTVAAAGDVRAAGFVGETLQDFESQATEGGEELIRAFEDDGDADAIVALRSFVAESGDSLDSLAGSVPPEAQDELAAAADALTDLDAAARSACPTCSDLEPLQLSSALLALRGDVDGVVEGLERGDRPAGPGAPPVTDLGPGAPGATVPTGELPTLPPPGEGSADGEPDGGAGGQPGDPPTEDPDVPDDPATTLPTLDPTLPSLDPTLPTLDPTLPSVPNPTEVVPTLVDPVETVLDPVETILDGPLGDLGD
jgi:hypothetical protein